MDSLEPGFLLGVEVPLLLLDHLDGPLPDHFIFFKVNLSHQGLHGQLVPQVLVKAADSWENILDVVRNLVLVNHNVEVLGPLLVGVFKFLIERLNGGDFLGEVVLVLQGLLQRVQLVLLYEAHELLDFFFDQIVSNFLVLAQKLFYALV